MTWLKGSTTWEVLPQLLAQLICGEVADGASTVLAAGDRWVRSFTSTVTDAVINGTATLTSVTANFDATKHVGMRVIAAGVPANTVINSVTNSTTVIMSKVATTSATGVTAQFCFDTIRTKAALDIASGNMSNRTGYYALIVNGGNLVTPMVTGTKQPLCRVVTPFTSNPTSSFGRWIVEITCAVANNVAGNYSTATYNVFVRDADSGANISSFSTQPSSAGVLSVLNGHTVSITEPNTGIVSVNTVFTRAFTTTYTYGVDLWPMLYREGNTAPTFTVAPPGVAGTDYDIVRIPYLCTTSVGTADRGGLLHGLGIKTATGLGSSNLYTLSFSMALSKGRIFASASGGQLNLDVGGSRLDPVNANVIRACGGLRIAPWAQCSTSSGSVTNSSPVQYWLSVKADGIALVLNMDPGSAGKLGTAWWGPYVPYEPTYDIFPISFNSGVRDYTVDNPTSTNFNLATQYPYLSLRRRQDGSEGARDWQTGWMRCEHLQANLPPAGTNKNDLTTGSVSGCALLSALGQSSFGGASAPTSLPGRENKPSVKDNKWWMYGTQYGEGDWVTGVSSDENRLLRGYQSDRYFWVPGDGWSSGDELTDTATSDKYLLIAADYHGLGARIRINSNAFVGGVAIKET